MLVAGGNLCHIPSRLALSVSVIGFSITLVIVLLEVLGGLTAVGHVEPVPDRGIELATATAEWEGRP